DVTVELSAQLAPLAAADRPHVHLVVVHVLEIVLGTVGDQRAVGGKAERAFADVDIVGQALDSAAGDLEQVEIARLPLFRRATGVSVVFRAVESEPPAIARDGHAGHGVPRVAGQPPGGPGREVERPDVDPWPGGVAYDDAKLRLHTTLLVGIDGVRREEEDRLAVLRDLPLLP